MTAADHDDDTAVYDPSRHVTADDVDTSPAADLETVTAYAAALAAALQDAADALEARARAADRETLDRAVQALADWARSGYAP